VSFIDLMLYNSSEVYTYSNSSTGCYSVIDYVCVSFNLINYIVKYRTVCNAFNMSDHDPLETELNVPLLYKIDNISSKPISNNPSIVYSATSSDNIYFTVEQRYRFDHCNKFEYYNYNRMLIEPLHVYNELVTVYNSLNYNTNIHELCNCSHIEIWYNSIINAVLEASRATVPRTGNKYFKH